MSWVSKFFVLAVCMIFMLNFGHMLGEVWASEDAAEEAKPVTWDQYYVDDKQATLSTTLTIVINSTRFCGPGVGGVSSGQCIARLSSVMAVIAGVKPDSAPASGCFPTTGISFQSMLNISTTAGNASLLTVTAIASNNTASGCFDSQAPRTPLQIITALTNNITAGINQFGSFYFFSKAGNDSYTFFKTILIVDNPSALTSTAQVFTDAGDSSGIDFLALGLGLGFGMGCLLLCCLCLLAPIVVPIACGIVILILVILALPIIVVFAVIVIVLLVVVVGSFLVIVGVIMLAVGMILRKTVYKKRQLLAEQAEAEGGGDDDFGVGFADDDL